MFLFYVYDTKQPLYIDTDSEYLKSIQGSIWIYNLEIWSPTITLRPPLELRWLVVGIRLFKCMTMEVFVGGWFSWVILIHPKEPSSPTPKVAGVRALSDGSQGAWFAHWDGPSLAVARPRREPAPCRRWSHSILSCSIKAKEDKQRRH